MNKEENKNKEQMIKRKSRVYIIAIVCLFILMAAVLAIRVNSKPELSPIVDSPIPATLETVEASTEETVSLEMTENEEPLVSYEDAIAREYTPVSPTDMTEGLLNTVNKWYNKNFGTFNIDTESMLYEESLITQYNTIVDNKLNITVLIKPIVKEIANFIFAESSNYAAAHFVPTEEYLADLDEELPEDITWPMDIDWDKSIPVEYYSCMINEDYTSKNSLDYTVLSKAIANDINNEWLSYDETTDSWYADLSLVSVGESKELRCGDNSKVYVIKITDNLFTQLNNDYTDYYKVYSSEVAVDKENQCVRFKLTRNEKVVDIYLTVGVDTEKVMILNVNDLLDFLYEI